MDNLVFEESINAEVPSSEFVEKQWLYVNDNNNSSYTGQVVLDTTSLSNSGSYINWSEAFLAIPLVLQVEQSAGSSLTSGLALDYAVGLKSGFWQILHSLSVEFNNGSIIQQTPFLNVFCSFKNLTSWSDEDLKNWGAVCGFYPDSSKSWLYNNSTVAASVLNYLNTSGQGFCNNRNAPYVEINSLPDQVQGTDTMVFVNTTTTATQFSNAIRSTYNEGFYKRQRWLNFNITQTGATPALTDVTSNQAALLVTTSGVLSSTGLNQIFMSYVQQAALTRSIVFDAVIRLKDVADFFYKCPLLKGSTMRIYLNTNQVFFTASAVNSAFTSVTNGTISGSGILALTAAPTILGGGGTNPVMLASMDLGQGLYPIVPVATGTPTLASIKVGLSIVKTQFSGFTTTVTAPVTAVRLYAPAYVMSPISEQRYLSLSPTKKIVYNDIFQYQYAGVPSGSFSFLVTNGIPNIRSVLVCAFLPKASNGTAQAYTTTTVSGVTTSSLLSPFSTSGGTPDPISITNFQIQVSGKNLFINQLQYDFETFHEQLAASNQLNGNLTTGLTSGLIGLEDFQSLYRYYYGNCSRSIPSEDGVAKSIQILGTNNTSITVDLMVFIEFQREITVDVRSGLRIA